MELLLRICAHGRKFFVSEVRESQRFGVIDVRVLKGPGGVQGEGVFLGNPEDSVWEDWGTLGKIRGITPL